MQPSEIAECPICLQALTTSDSIYQTDCLHQFCGECITRSLSAGEVNAACPLCRAVIKRVKLLRAPVRAQSLYQRQATGGTPTRGDYQSLSNGDAGTSSNTVDDIIIVQVKYNRCSYEVPISLSIKLQQLKQQLAVLFGVDKTFCKLVYRGRVLITDQQLREILHTYAEQMDSAAHQPTDARPISPSHQLTFQLIAAVADANSGKWHTDQPKASKCAIT